jgi:lipopolysaccharide heptosyltransferase II
VPFARKDGFSAPIRFLRDGNLVGVLVDQHAGDGGAWTPFFGRLASTSPLAATLALRTGARIVPVAIYTDASAGLARWRFVVSEPIRYKERSNDLTPEQLTAEINQVLERQIRVSPRDWFWVHNRWKTPKPKFLLASYKRGITLPENFPAEKLKPFRILIRSTNWLGDAVMSAPAVRVIKRGRPDAHMSVLVRGKLADFWKTVAEVDDVISIEPNEGLLQMARKIAAGNFDAAILFPNSVRTALEAWIAGVPRRVGYRAKWRGQLLNQFIERRKKKEEPQPSEHQVFHYLRLAEAIGAQIIEETTVVQNAALNYAARLRPGVTFDSQLSTLNSQLGLCPGAEYGPAKRWLPERFAEVARRVIEKHPECKWMLLGVNKDHEIGAQIETALGGNCTNFIGKTTLAELIEQLRKCRLLLTNDTGTMHLAAHLGVPTIAIFGSTEHTLTGPLGAHSHVVRHHVACSPCFLRECPLDFRCMNAVSVEEVAAEVLRIIGHSA